MHIVEGLALFEKFLESEFSQENLQFWEACEQYRRLPAKMLASESQKIYQLYLSVQSPREVIKKASYFVIYEVTGII